jgi:hypothetical protein
VDRPSISSWKSIQPSESASKDWNRKKERDHSQSTKENKRYSTHLKDLKNGRVIDSCLLRKYSSNNLTKLLDIDDRLCESSTPSVKNQFKIKGGKHTAGIFEA